MKNHGLSSARLARAAATGLFLAACEEPPQATPDAGTTKSATPAQAAPAAPKADKDCCFGKNDCKGKGGCAVPESHACAGQNDCKGKGGCSMHCPK